MPADSAVGEGVTPVCPMRRGQTGCGAFRLRRARGQTAAGSRAGACRLRRFWGDGAFSPRDSGWERYVYLTRRAAVPADSAFGEGVTPVCPTSRGQTGCGAFRLRRARGQTAAGSRAGACRLRRFWGDGAFSPRDSGWERYVYLTRRAAVPADSAVGEGVTPVCPTSRGQTGCGAFRLRRARGQTAAGSRAGACRLRRVGRRCLAPVGQGALRGCVFDAVCPCGAKALLSGAPDHGVSREEAGFWNVLPITGAFPARPGDGSMPSCAP